MKKMIAISMCILVILGSTACKSKDSIANAVYPASEPSNQEKIVNQEFIKIVNDFSFVTTSEIIRGKAENVTYSPISLYVALSVAASGTNGITKDEMMELLGVSDLDYLSEENKKLIQLLYFDEKVGRLKIANSLWLKKGHQFKDTFIDNAVNNYYASLYSVDFAHKKTGGLMGKWISDNTYGLITPEVKTSGNQLLSIINTIYLKDEWSDQFSENNTKPADFHLNGEELVEVDFMKQALVTNSYVKGEGYISAALKLKTLGEMVFVLPDVGVDVEELLASPQQIAKLFREENNEDVKVVYEIPKFKFGSKFDLIDNLSNLGMESAFGGAADFSGITNSAAYISAIKQETFVSIDEKGVEAAAYTQIDMCESAEMPKEYPIVEMTLDRPFIFAIRSNDGVLLFVGVVYNPVE